MRTNVTLLAGLALAGVAVGQSLPESGAVALKTKIQRRQKLLLPGEAATAVAADVSRAVQGLRRSDEHLRGARLELRT